MRADVESIALAGGTIPVDRVDRVDVKPDAPPIAQFIDEVRDRLGLANCIYHCPTLKGFDLVQPYIAATHSQEWREHYIERKYIEIDPAYNLGARSALPLDWDTIDRSDKKIRAFFGEAADAGVGRHGLTIPVRGPANGVWALFGISTNDSDRDWTLRRTELVRDAVMLAHFVHQRAVEVTGSLGEPLDFRTITPREREALFWAAEGKTIKDTAQIMRISSETVKAHLDSARSRLGALTRAHAVAKALRAGLIK